MFTGIIEEVGTVKQVRKKNKSLQLAIETTKILDTTQLGDSISVDGVCLTVTTMNNKSFTADVMPETYTISTLQHLKTNTKVNLERAATMSTRLGGHIVSGHVDTTAKITKILKKDNAVLYTLKLTKKEYHITKKDSISIDGISLTVQDVKNDSIVVSIIPHTIVETTLKYKQINSIVNIEFDTLKKQKIQKSKITMSYLESNGFL